MGHRRSRGWVALLSSLLIGATACSAAGGGGDADDAGQTGQAPTPGPSAEGWQKAYVEGGVGFACGDDLDAVVGSGAPSLTVGATTVAVGFEQVGDNQNPLLVRYDDGGGLYCVRHETEGPDGRAVGITWDGGDIAYIVYTVVGGGTSLEGKGGWVPSYAPGSVSGGGAKVSYVGRVDMTSGALLSGSFLIAIKSDNGINSHTPRGAVTVLEDGHVEFLGQSAHKPIDLDLQAMDCSDYPFDARYVMTPDLSQAVCADSTNCVSESPCP